MRLIIASIMFLVSTQVFGQVVEYTTIETYRSPDYSSDYDGAGNRRLGKRNPNEMTKIGKPYSNKEWSTYKANNEYVGEIDRKVLVSGMTPEQAANPNDTSKVLVSNTKEVIYIAKAEDSAIQVKENVDAPITTTAWLEDEETGSTTKQTKCLYNNNTITCDVF